MSLRPHLTYANVVSTFCLFILLGGSAYAATMIGSKQIKDNSVQGRDIRNNSVAGKDIKTKSLLSKNFKPGQLPTGPRGSTGPRGATGETGPTGAPGSALAYAHVRADGTLDTARSKGVLGVTEACSGSGGAYPLCDVAPRSPGPGTNQCIDLAEGISPKSAVVSADADGPVSGFNSIVAVQIPSEIPSSTSSAGCGPGYRDAEVVTYDRDFASDGSSGNQGFYVSFN